MFSAGEKRYETLVPSFTGSPDSLTVNELTNGEQSTNFQKECVSFKDCCHVTSSTMHFSKESTVTAASSSFLGFLVLLWESMLLSIGRTPFRSKSEGSKQF